MQAAAIWDEAKDVLDMAGSVVCRSKQRWVGLGLAWCLSALWAMGGCDRAGTNPCNGSSNQPYSAPTLVGALYDSCFTSGGGFRDGKVGLMLYLDTGNLPSDNGNIPWLTVSSQPIHGVAGRDRLGIRFTGSLPGDIDPGIRLESGWKLVLTEGQAVQCSSCVNQCGLVPIVQVEANVNDMQFIRDAHDTLGVYLHFRRGIP